MIILAYLIDLIIGDPEKIPHPVVLIGTLISKLERILYNPQHNDTRKFLYGAFLVILVSLIAYSFTWLLIYSLNSIHYLLGLAASIWIISTTIAVKGLANAGAGIAKVLSKGNLSCARKELGFIVGRDTGELDEKEIIRGTVETIAENIVDGVTSPLFFALLGGAPLAIAYRAVNTMDSMLGYKNDRYLYFGRAAARLDDIINFIPARLTGLCISLVSLAIPGISGRNSIKILLRDARNHPSPNSGFAESAVSGALQVRLGGLNYYQGIPSQRPFIGDEINPLDISAIKNSIVILYSVSAVWVLLLTIVQYLLDN
ncbi:MAG: adenosylcobinamide-phosphate synthase CbiB [Bacillota bacterium]